MGEEKKINVFKGGEKQKFFLEKEFKFLKLKTYVIQGEKCWTT